MLSQVFSLSRFFLLCGIEGYEKGHEHKGDFLGGSQRQMGGERESEGETWSKSIVCTMERGEGERGDIRVNRGGAYVKVLYTHVWSCHFV